MIESIKHPIYSSMERSIGSNSSGTNAVCSVRVDCMSGLVMSPQNPFSGVRTALDWELSDKDLDVNYIVHAVKDVVRS